MSQIHPSIGRPGRGAARALFGGLAIAIAAVAAQPSFAHSDGPRGGHGMMAEGGGHHHRHMGRMLDHVDATDAQRAAIKSIREAAAAKAKPLREQRRALQREAQALLNSPGAIDRGAAENLRLRMLALHDQASKIRSDAMLDIADQLTPAQRQKIGEMMAKRAERMRERHQDHMRHHQGGAQSKS